MESNVVDGVTRISLPGRKWGLDQGLRTNSPVGVDATGGMPCFVAGPENLLLATIIQQLLQNHPWQLDGRRPNQFGPPAGTNEENSPLTINAPGNATSSLAPFSPLVLLGSSGFGKTHLARGLANWFGGSLNHHKTSRHRVALFSAVEFGRHFCAARENNQLGHFRDSLQSLHLLVIEDLHLVRPGASMQQELRIAIDHLIGLARIVIATSQKPLVALRKLEPGLRDRLTSGLTIRLQQPEKAARLAIIQMAASVRGTHIDPRHASLLAEQVDGPAPRLFNALLQYEQDLPSGSSTLSGPTLSMRQIIAVVARYYSIPQKVLRGPSRRRSTVQARNVSIYLTRTITGISYSQIGRALGNRDHTTIMHAMEKLKKQLATDPATQEAIDELKHLLGPP